MKKFLYLHKMSKLQSAHGLKEKVFVYLDNQLVGKKLAPRCIGPYLVTKVINNQNVKLQISAKRTQIHSAYKLKKFVNPAKYFFK